MMGPSLWHKKRMNCCPGPQARRMPVNPVKIDYEHFVMHSIQAQDDLTKHPPNNSDGTHAHSRDMRAEGGQSPMEKTSSRSAENDQHEEDADVDDEAGVEGKLSTESCSFCVHKVWDCE